MKIGSRWLTIAPFLIVIAIFLGYTASLLASIWPIDQLSISNSGLFGDSFGLLNALFSGLGLAGVLVALLLQQKQLKIQQAELNSTQEELRRQSILFDQQKFDESFFKLLTLVRTNLESLYATNAQTKEEVRGVNLLASKLGRLRETLKLESVGTFPESEDERVLYVWRFWKTAMTGLGRQTRYVDTVGCLVEWIAKHCPRSVDPVPYWQLAGAQLTVLEAQYLAYQTLLSPETHALRRYFDPENPLFFRFLTCGLKHNHVTALLWINGFTRSSIHSPRASPVSAKMVSTAKRNLRARKAGSR